MTAALLCLVGLVAVPAAAQPGPERLEVAAEDAELGQAVARSIGQHLPGSVLLVRPLRGDSEPQGLRLSLRHLVAGRLHLVLSQGPSLRVERTLAIGSGAALFDVAESVALALLDLRARLDEARARHREEVRRIRRVVRPVRPPRAAALSAADPPAAELPASPGALPPAPPSAAPEPPPAPRQARRWKLALGMPLTAVGLGLVALGVTSLAVDGRCVDAACDRRYAGRVAGGVELGVGLAAALAGAGLVAAHLSLAQRSRGPHRHIALVPGIAPAGGALVALVFVGSL